MSRTPQTLTKALIRSTTQRSVSITFVIRGRVHMKKMTGLKDLDGIPLFSLVPACFGSWRAVLKTQWCPADAHSQSTSRFSRAVRRLHTERSEPQPNA